MPRNAMILGIFLTVSASACATLIKTEVVSLSEYETELRTKMIETASQFKKGEAPAEVWEWSGAAQTVSMAGREDLIAAVEQPEYAGTRYTCDSTGETSAIDNIAERAKAHSLVIINEDHAKPQHRLFIRDLAIRLRAQGFTHYAAETFTPAISGGAGYPQTGEGYFTREPVFARLVHQIRNLDYKLVAYEIRLDQFPPEDADSKTLMATREEAQAQNLMDAVLASDPTAKMIVHVGHGHGQEAVLPRSDFGPLMAARLKQKSGIDPLTIEMTLCKSVTGQTILSDSALLKNGERAPLLTDYWIAFSSLEFTRGRPNYRLEMGDQFVDVPEALKPDEDPVLIEARPPSTELGKSPVERLFLAPGEDVPLLLPPGDWSLISIDAEGTITGPVEVSVGGE